MVPRKRAKPNPVVERNSANSPTNMPPQNSNSNSSSSDDGADDSAASATGQPRGPSPFQSGGGASGDGGAAAATSSSSTANNIPGRRRLQDASSQVRKTHSWYGSWPRKSAASTQVACETIHGGTLRPSATADFSRFETRKNPEAASLSGIPESSVSSLRIAENGKNTEDVSAKLAQAEIDDAPKDAIPKDAVPKDAVPKDAAPKDAVPKNDTPKAPESNAEPSPDDKGKDQDKDKNNDKDKEADDNKAPAPSEPQVATKSEQAPKPAASSSWFVWLGMSSEPEQVKEPAVTATEVAAAETEVAPPTLPQEPPKEPSNMPKEPPAVPITPAIAATPAAPAETTDTPSQPKVEKASAAAAASAGGSWFGFWSSTPAPPPPQAEQSAPDTEIPSSDPVPVPVPVSVSGPGTGPSQPATVSEDVVMQDAPPAPGPPEPPPKAGSTWAFWSRDTDSKPSDKTSIAETGQLAVIGESSESHPERASSVEVKDTSLKEPAPKSARKEEVKRPMTPPVKETLSKKPKKVRPQSMELDEPMPASPSTPRTDVTPKVEPPAKPGTSKTPILPKVVAPNLLLPTFRSTYRMKENPSILSQITRLLMRAQAPPANHVFLSAEQPKIRKAIAIGVHGLFPANYLRPMIGQPTGTSIRFANHCAEAIRRWAKGHDCGDCEIEKVALEGDGKIGERVENLWKLLLNWIDHIRDADLVVVACHSQGVPVGLILLAKLIELGVITTAKIGVCAMAGVSLGPFPDYRSSMGMLMPSANELWEFAKPESEISQRLEAAVKVVLAYGGRITYVGSMDDQLVPMESAVYSPAHHPYIYRAVFVDSRIHPHDFIAHLVGFALKLRNLGISDHGLMRELSLPLAGSLVGGEGHSRLYDEEQIYDLALMHTLETTDVGGGGSVPCEIRKHEGLVTANPYHLPWIMRGLLEEDFVKTELSAETAELLRRFDDWKPVTKALRDVKYRLEVVRSKL